MIIAAIIVGIILLFFVFFTLYMYDEEDSTFADGLKLGVIITLLVFMEVGIISDTQPTAMDVYQNKTTIEYKVVDDVKVDSIVIFKEEFKK